MSSEFERVVIGGLYGKKVSLAAENEFWNGATAATQTAVAALTAGTGQTSVGAAEKTLVAALTASQTDGIVVKMIYNASNDTLTAGVGTRVKVAGAALAPLVAIACGVANAPILAALLAIIILPIPTAFSAMIAAF